MQDDASGRRRGALLLCALAAPAAQYCAAAPWPWVLAGTGAAGLYYIYMEFVSRRAGAAGLCPAAADAFGGGGGACALGLTAVFTVFAAACACRDAADSFPNANAFPFLPALTLLLAAWSASKGPEAVGRAGAVLAAPAAVLLGAAAAFAAPDVRAQNLLPGGTWRDAAAPLAVFLLPAGARVFRREGRGGAGWYPLAAALAALCSAVTVGCLGLPLARASGNAFYEMSKSVSAFAVFERFEALVSAAALLSRTVLLALLLAECAEIAAHLLPRLPRAVSVWGAAALALGGAWLVPLAPKGLLFWGAVVFWGILPGTILGVVSMRKSSENKQKRVDKGSLF